jgi:predicted phosphodiesterase
MPYIKSIQFQDNSLIGIIADSHGHVAQLSQAIDFLSEKKCKILIHLGDICDSVNFHTADECISIIQKHHVIAIRGNNDHAIFVNKNKMISQSTLDYIQSLPLVIQSQTLTFAHSLPFVNALGLSCMIQNLNSHFLKLCFNSLGENAILFRGHSHQPEIIVQSVMGYQELKMDFPFTKELTRLFPCIISCGTVMKGHCMVYDPDDQILMGCLIDQT